MRFVAGQGAVLRCCVQGSVAEMLLAGALWRSCCWPESCGGKPSGINCWPGRSSGAASGSQQTRTKREGPGRDLNISPEPLLFIALRKGYTPCDEAEPPFTAGMQCWHALQAKLPTAFISGIHRRHSVQAKLPPACSAGEVAAAIMQGLQGRLQQMQELRRALGIRQG